MLYFFFDWLAHDISAFNVFRYLTLRAILGVLTALTICFVIGPALIRRLTQYKVGQVVRSDGPQSHLAKAGTPTMGGALILIAVFVSTLLWANLNNRFVWVVLVPFSARSVGWTIPAGAQSPKGLSAKSILAERGRLSVAVFVRLPRHRPRRN